MLHFKSPNSIFTTNWPNISKIFFLSVASSSLVTAQLAQAQCNLSFDDQTYYPTGNGPYSVVIGDLDADGDLDIVIANSLSDDISVLIGNGDGTFVSETRYSLRPFSNPESVALGDLNNDGTLDIVVASNGSDDMSSLLGNGDGTFAPYSYVPVGLNPSSISLGDLDGDGNLDVVLGNGSEEIYVLFGMENSTGFFQTRLAVGIQPRSTALGDLNNDGDLDIVAANFIGGNTSVLLGVGDLQGSFEPQTLYQAGFLPQSIILGDLNDDDYLDIVIANWGGEDTSVLLGNGDGTFAAQTRYNAGVQPFSVTLGDLDLDGDLDMVVANLASHDVSVLLGNNDGSFDDQTRYSVGNTPRSVTLGDLDGDGDLDIVIANMSSDNISILLNLCNSSYCVADFNTDGVLNFFDISAFIMAYTNQDLVADITDDGLFSFFDISAFIALFNTGCP